MKAKLALLAAGAQLWAQEAPEDALFDWTLRELSKGRVTTLVLGQRSPTRA